mmetsp:Transcript_46864/g.77553  ORF Transcript_46864/g.77553 Transcript_46864/m.77553 type:complete len:220 (+) Transcript_46864:94-753(+)|eukprot:CAMPEP_0119341130 /NCGR_PEP_ID=MMETSP1333-20130426/101696_1 /TAXON_ID=418940 /ORGANISM="Scyphosphaera apsteinii, Strain RCC1455" /LENGTH=219 /DNA_ID=CAMNT_0007353027 /DNA_START=22 /DNA_END=681 /DNA_ORIENTATION=+
MNRSLSAGHAPRNTKALVAFADELHRRRKVLDVRQNASYKDSDASVARAIEEVVFAPPKKEYVVLPPNWQTVHNAEEVRREQFVQKQKTRHAQKWGASSSGRRTPLARPLSGSSCCSSASSMFGSGLSENGCWRRQVLGEGGDRQGYMWNGKEWCSRKFPSVSEPRLGVRQSISFGGIAPKPSDAPVSLSRWDSSRWPTLPLGRNETRLSSHNVTMRRV